MLKSLNLLVRFVLELSILFSLGYWGFKTGSSALTRILLGVGGPALFALLWGIFLSPKAAVRLGEPWHLLLEIAVFALACWALYGAGKTTLALIFGGVYILNKLLLVAWRQ